MSQLKTKPTVIDLSDYPDDFSPCHRRVLSARGIPAEQLKKSLSQLYPVALLTDAKAAAQRLYHAIQTQQKIVIVGDYDADGATAMATLVSVFQHLHARVDSVIPNRVSMGYGLSEKAVCEAMSKGAELVITVDNGIAAVDSVALLKSHGIDVIITDHHLPPAVLPAADFIVNPNRKDCGFPSKSLAGVGVAFYFVLALRQVYRDNGKDNLDNYQLVDLLAYVAIGTIADVVPLDFNNRILVEQGLKRIRTQRCSAGVLALIDASGLSADNLTATDIAFQVAPRLNAAGRIADMSLGVDCLLTDNSRLAFDYAVALDNLNRERKSMENEMRLQADRLLAEQLYTPAASAVICVFDANWNEGLIGILASRLKDRYNKTAFVFTRADSSHGDLLKASARAADGVNLLAALNDLNDLQPQLLANYGGHAKAAGLSLTASQLDAFSNGIAKVVARQLADVVPDDAIYTDGELLPYEMNVANAEFLRSLEPWGSHLPEPLFENTFYIDKIREVGKNHAKIALIEERSGLTFAGIAFNQYQFYDNLDKSRCRVAYRLAVNEWRGQRSLSLTVTHIERHGNKIPG